MRSHARSALLLATFLVLVLGVGNAVLGTGPENLSKPPGGLVHSDPADVEAALLDATLAFVYGDMAAAKGAMDRIEKGCRDLSIGTGPEVPERLVSVSRAFRIRLNVARELAAKEQLKLAREQFFWIQRACRDCHVIARENGLPAPETGAQSGSGAR